MRRRRRHEDAELDGPRDQPSDGVVGSHEEVGEVRVQALDTPARSAAVPASVRLSHSVGRKPSSIRRVTQSSMRGTMTAASSSA